MSAKISELPDADLPLTGTELMEVVQGGVNKKVAKSDVSTGGGGAVDSVNGETGVVVLDATDVGADPAGSASTVNTALGNHISDSSDAHAGTAITNTPAGNLSATNVQAAINELDTEKAALTQIIGVQDFFIPAAAFWPRVTAGCSSLTQTEIATSLINIQTLDFNQTTQQFAQTHFKFPKKYNLGTLTYEIEWTATTGTGSVVWGLAAVSLADGDALTTAFGSQINVTDAAGTANTERTSATSAAVTIGNTPAVADGIYLQITRVTGDGSDDMAADAKFKGITIHITTNAATDV